MAKEFKFKENKIYENGHKLEIRFEGIEKENVDLDKVNNLLNKFIVDQSHHRTMVRNVANIRAILKGFEEKILVISHSDSNGSKEIVKYDNGNLFLYEYNIKGSISDEDQISIKYSPNNSLDFSFEDFDGNIVDYPNFNGTIKRFTDIVNKIYQLKHVSAIELDRDSKVLIEIYKLFYNENPDFSDKTINIKIQTMMSILVEFGISLGDDYSFSLWGKVKMPISLYLEEKVDRLFPLGEVVDIDEPIELAKEEKNTIRIAGECIRESISDNYNKEEALITISKIIYAGRYSLSSESNIKELSDFANRTQHEVESSIQLVKRIEKKIRQTDSQQ